jgi:hypothetical protein
LTVFFGVLRCTWDKKERQRGELIKGNGNWVSRWLQWDIVEKVGWFEAKVECTGVEVVVQSYSLKTGDPRIVAMGRFLAFRRFYACEEN